MKIWDKVQITNLKECYTTAQRQANKMWLMNYNYWHNPIKQKDYEIIWIEKHIYNNVLVIAIRGEDKKEYLIGEKWLELVEKIEELKEWDVVYVDDLSLERAKKNKTEYIFLSKSKHWINICIDKDKKDDYKNGKRFICTPRKYAVKKETIKKETIKTPEYTMEELEEKIGYEFKIKNL